MNLKKKHKPHEVPYSKMVLEAIEKGKDLLKKKPLDEELIDLAMDRLSINRTEARLMVEPLIQRAEKVWEKEGISMPELEKRKFLYALVSAYEEMAKDFVKSIE